MKTILVLCVTILANTIASAGVLKVTGFEITTSEGTGICISLETEMTAIVAKPGEIRHDSDGTIKSIGGADIKRDSEGNIKSIGSTDIKRDSDGTIKSIGDAEIKRDSDGTIKSIGNADIKRDSDGNITSVDGDPDVRAILELTE